MAGSADLKFGELVEFNLDCVVGISLALSLGLLGLHRQQISQGYKEIGLVQSTYVLNNLASSAVCNDSVSEAEGRVVVLVLHRQLHSAEQG